MSGTTPRQPGGRRRESRPDRARPDGSRGAARRCLDQGEAHAHVPLAPPSPSSSAEGEPHATVASTEYLDTTDLQAGTTYHYLVATNDEGASAPSNAVSVEIPVTTEPGVCAAGQWSAEYFNGTSLSGDAVIVECVDSMNFDWNAGSPATGVNANRFSARWTTSFEGAGTYEFSARADDGIRVFVDGESVIDEWSLVGAHSSATSQSTPLWAPIPCVRGGLAVGPRPPRRCRTRSATTGCAPFRCRRRRRSPPGRAPRTRRRRPSCSRRPAWLPGCVVVGVRRRDEPGELVARPVEVDGVRHGLLADPEEVEGARDVHAAVELGGGGAVLLDVGRVDARVVGPVVDDLEVRVGDHGVEELRGVAGPCSWRS
ncbi:PA14 domain-containing protein [Georgenia sp. SUBG003]|uniref:PA14 domain-containing protein n=1 Tax=Georgenia sp. SUBG003 TaxID=1497974 RepID=UPI003AB6D0AF